MRLFSTLIIVFSFFLAHSEILSPEASLSLIKERYANVPVGTRSGSQIKLLYTLTDSETQPAVYVFTLGENNGFIVSSAEDQGELLLGYSLEGKFDKENLPPALIGWLNEYKSQVEYMRNHGAVRSIPTDGEEGWSAVTPLVKTQWDQESPYNSECWLILGSEKLQCPTGCVATAMAQVMNYFQYPEVGQGSISYSPYGNAAGYSIDFAAQPFQWDLMLDSYDGEYTEEEASAVAYLMKACGYSVRMVYSQGGSGADDFEILNALYTYFKYSGESRFAKRIFYNDEEWKEMLYTHLSTVGPAIYNGRASFGGHSFVCDGYDGNGYFHFNWGWSGMGDGYFLLGSMNPGVQGVGGFAGGYNLDHSMILPVAESDNTLPAEVQQYGSLSASLEEKIITLTLSDYEGETGWAYSGIPPYSFDFYLMLENTEDASQKIIIPTNLKEAILQLGRISYYSPVEVNVENLEIAEGSTYKATLVTTRANGADEDYVAVKAVNGLYNSFNLTFKNGELSITNNEVKPIEIMSVEPQCYLVYNAPSIFNITISNPSPFQITRILRLGFINSKGTFCYTSDANEITINPGETTTFEFISEQWNRINRYPEVKTATEFTLKVIDESTGEYYPRNEEETVVVFPEGTEISLTVTPEPGQLPEGELLSEIILGWGYSMELLAGDDISVDIDNEEISNLEIEISSGMSQNGESVDNGFLKIGIPAESRKYNSIYTMHLPASTVEIDVDGTKVGNPEMNFVYYVGWPAMVNEIKANDKGLIKVNDLKGVTILETENKEELKTLPKGIYVINGKTTLIP